MFQRGDRERRTKREREREKEEGGEKSVYEWNLIRMLHKIKKRDIGIESRNQPLNSKRAFQGQTSDDKSWKTYNTNKSSFLYISLQNNDNFGERTEFGGNERSLGK